VDAGYRAGDINREGVNAVREAALRCENRQSGPLPAGVISGASPRSGLPVLFSSVLVVQATTGSNHAARRTKLEAEGFVELWKGAGATLEIWSWKKRVHGEAARRGR
jgi:hypothetical protein